jgi:hypothetical protein
MPHLLRVTQTFKRVQDRYNLSVPNVLLRAFRSPTVPQNQRDTLTQLALGARGPRFESGRPDQLSPTLSLDYLLASTKVRGHCGSNREQNRSDLLHSFSFSFEKRMSVDHGSLHASVPEQKLEHR